MESMASNSKHTAVGNVPPTDAFTIIDYAHKYGDGSTVGEFRRLPDGTVVLHKQVQKKWQIFARPCPGWAVENEHLVELLKYGGTLIEIEVIGGDKLTARLEDFEPYGQPLDCPGYGPQTVLPLARWQRDVATEIATEEPTPGPVVAPVTSQASFLNLVEPEKRAPVRLPVRPRIVAPLRQRLQAAS